MAPATPPKIACLRRCAGAPVRRQVPAGEGDDYGVVAAQEDIDGDDLQQGCPERRVAQPVDQGCTPKRVVRVESPGRWRVAAARLSCGGLGPSGPAPACGRRRGTLLGPANARPVPGKRTRGWRSAFGHGCDAADRPRDTRHAYSAASLPEQGFTRLSGRRWRRTRRDGRLVARVADSTSRTPITESTVQATRPSAPGDARRCHG